MTTTHMKPVAFHFDQTKLVHALAYFASKGVNDLTKLKAAKLVYFVDKRHLWKFGRPVVGGPYFCMPFGPVPSRALQTMNDVIDAKEIEAESFDAASNRLIEDFLEVRFEGSYPRFAAKNAFDADVFSNSELLVLGDVLAEFGARTARELVDLTHQDPTWITPDKVRDKPGGRVPMPYELFFEDATPEVRQIWQFIEADHEERELDDELSDLVAVGD